MPPIADWPQAIVFWIVFAWAFVPEVRLVSKSKKAEAQKAQSQDAKSLRVLMLGMRLGMVGAFVVALNPRFSFPYSFRTPALWIGTALLAAGSALRRHCWHMLGRYFTGNVQTVAGQQVIDRGAYAYVRHPSYTAGIVMFAGIGIALNSWLSTIVAIASAIGAYLYRVRVEEAALAAALGQPYVDYMKTRKRFIPYVL